MKDRIQIKVHIAERIYPMKIDPDDEPLIRGAAKKLNSDMMEFSSKFKVTDKQDIMAMVSFDAVLSLKKEYEAYQSSEKKIDLMLSELEELGF